MPTRPDVPRLRQLATHELEGAEVSAIREIMSAAFGSGEEAFSDDDWQHAIGGLHFVLDVGGLIVTHASVVEREIRLGESPLRTGYVEAVATAPDWQGQGFGTLVMTAVTERIRRTYELGALGTGRHHFYEQLGWRTWRGPAFVRLPEGTRRTPDDEGYILVLSTKTSPRFNGTESISCDWRPGDAW